MLQVGVMDVEDQTNQEFTHVSAIMFRGSEQLVTPVVVGNPKPPLDLHLAANKLQQQ